MGKIERTSKFAEELVNDLKKAKWEIRSMASKRKQTLKLSLKVMKLQSNASVVRSAMFRKLIM